ncbi:hypothetical protein hp2017_1367 [Helicobacter pylori 2017]|nr:hypothetical protein hp2017_1367 [Helicobacter pylori 2017]
MVVVCMVMVVVLAVSLLLLLLHLVLLFMVCHDDSFNSSSLARISFYNAKSNQLLTKKILILIFNTSTNSSAPIVKTTNIFE